LPIQLTTDQLAAYHRDGYVVVEDLLSPAAVDQLRARLYEYTHGGRPNNGIKIQIEPRIERVS
jgi:hypothetical protein